LAAAPAIGAIISGLVMAKYGFGRRPGVMMLSAVAIYALATLAFGISRTFSISVVLLGIVGATDIISTVIRQTTSQLITPDRLRGRMTSINMIFFNGGPRLGELQAGMVAAALGAPLAVILGGITCLSAVLAITPKLRSPSESKSPCPWLSGSWPSRRRARTKLTSKCIGFDFSLSSVLAST
jgi:MFS family permease